MTTYQFVVRMKIELLKDYPFVVEAGSFEEGKKLAEDKAWDKVGKDYGICAGRIVGMA